MIEQIEKVKIVKVNSDDHNYLAQANNLIIFKEPNIYFTYVFPYFYRKNKLIKKYNRNS